MGGRSEVITRPLRFGSLLLTGALVACGLPHKFPVAHPVAVAPPTGPMRPLVEAPPPAELPNMPTPALKPGTEESSTNARAPSGDVVARSPSEAVITESLPGSDSSAPPSSTSPAGSASAPTGSEATASATPSSPVSPDTVPPQAGETDPQRLVGITDAEAIRLLGQPISRTDIPPSRVWLYRSSACDVKLFFYPEVGGSSYRALTFEINNHDRTDANNRACMASLRKANAG
jgi:hypothetical protein